MAEQLTTPRLYAAADTHVYRDENQNRHAADYVNFGRYGSNYEYGFFRFAAPELPAGARIVSARMHFKVRYKSAGDAFTFTVRPAGAAWTETGLKGNAMPTTEGVSDTVSIGWGVSSADVTASVAALLNGSCDWANGLYIACPKADSNTSVFSRTHETADSRPYLVITYEMPVSVPSLDAEEYALGDTVRVSIARAEDGSTHALRYMLGENVVAARSGVDAQDSFALTLAMAGSITNSEFAVLTVACDTYMGDELQGTRSVSATVRVPASVIPTIASVTVTEGAQNWPQALTGIFVQGRSRLAVQVDAAGAMGSTIEEIAVTVEGARYTGASVLTQPVRGSGGVAVSVAVLDSRGRAAAVEVSALVTAYQEPSVGRFSVWRSLQNGAYDLCGEYAAVAAAASASALGGLNAISCAVDSRPSGASAWTQAGTLAVTGGAVSEAGAVLACGAVYDDLTGYEFRLRIADLFCEKTALSQIPTKLVVLDVSATGRGIGVGCEADREGAVTVALDAVFLGALSATDAGIAGLQGAWAELTPSGTIAAGEGADAPMVKRAGNRVSLKGAVVGALAAGGTAVAMLPEGMRPDRTVRWWGASGGARACLVSVSADGAVTVACYALSGGAYTGSAWHALDGSFERA